MCHNSYDRLIDLAQRTGDRLIVHNPIDCQDTVIMSVDEYEKLIDNKDNFDSEGCRDVRSLSSNQMLDQINRDIAIWRAEKEQEGESDREIALDDEFAEETPFDPFAEQDYHPKSWHSAGSVLGDRYNDFYDDFEGEDKHGGDEEDEIADFDFSMDDWSDEDEFGQEKKVDSQKDLSQKEPEEDEIKIEDIPFDIDLSKIEDVKIDIPFLNQDLEGEDWNEEPLDSDDDPVFYEEPV